MRKLMIALMLIVVFGCTKKELNNRTFEYKVFNPTYDIEFTYIDSGLNKITETTEAGVVFRYRGEASRFETVGLSTNNVEHTTFTIYYGSEVYERFEVEQFTKVLY